MIELARRMSSSLMERERRSRRPLILNEVFFDLGLILSGKSVQYALLTRILSLLYTTEEWDNSSRFSNSQNYISKCFICQSLPLYSLTALHTTTNYLHVLLTRPTSSNAFSRRSTLQRLKPSDGKGVQQVCRTRRERERWRRR